LKKTQKKVIKLTLPKAVGQTGQFRIHGSKEVRTFMPMQPVDSLLQTRTRLEHIENGPVWFDLYTLPCTVRAVLFSREAY